MEISKTSLPPRSVLAGVRYHYADSYSSRLDERDVITIEDVAKAFFSSAPRWVDQLFGLRNRVAGLFGLKTGGGAFDRAALAGDFKCEVGEKIGLFRILAKSDDEIIFGEDDKHLDFRVSLFLQTQPPGEKELVITTVVEFHNWFGRIYFIPVRPFHQLIVPAILKGIVRRLARH